MTARITIDGNLTDDPEFGVSDSGKSWARLRVATHERIRQQDGTWDSGPAQYFNVAVFDEAAERVANEFHKGDAVNVAGRIEVEEFDRRDGSRGVGIKVFARHVDASERSNRRSAPAFPADIAVQVNNPDDPTLPPLYEGPADGAHQALIPGIYRATTLDDDQAPVRLVVQSDRATAAPAAAARPEAAPSASTSPASEPTVHHNATGTVVDGVGRADTDTHAMLKQVGFKWSAASARWFLPAGLDEQTRSLRVDDVVAAMSAAGKPVTVTDADPTVPDFRREFEASKRGEVINDLSAPAPGRSL